jgi:hypothetical protein
MEKPCRLFLGVSHGIGDPDHSMPENGGNESDRQQAPGANARVSQRDLMIGHEIQDKSQLKVR